jgi:hypothetical protein
MVGAVKRGPGVYGSETDLAVQVQSFGINNGAIVVNSERGPLGWSKVTGGPTAITKKYGKGNYLKYQYGVNCAKVMAETLQAVWVFRGQGSANFPLLKVGGTGTDTMISLNPLTDPTTFSFGTNDKFLIYPIGPGLWPITDQMGVLVTSTGDNMAANQIAIRVYRSSTTNVVEGPFIVTLVPGKDGFGKQTFIEDVINTRSALIRVINNPANTSATAVNAGSGLFTQFVTGSGAAEVFDAGSISNSEIKGAWDLLTDRNTYDAQHFCNAGYFDPGVHDKMLRVAAARVDAYAYLDFNDIDQPNADLAVQAYLTRAQGPTYVGLDLGRADFGEIDGPMIQVRDDDNDRLIFLPASAFAIRQVGYTLNSTNKIFQPAAGEVYGRSPSALSVQYAFNPANQADLYAGNVNYFINIPGAGICLFAQNTLYALRSPYRLRHVRRLYSQFRIDCEKFLRFYLFKLNTVSTRESAKDKLDTYFKGFQDEEGLYWFQVVCDETNNPPAVIDTLVMNVDVYLQPTLDAEIINFRMTTVETGVNISEIVAGGTA